MKTRTKILGGSIGAIVLLLFIGMVLTYNCMKAEAPAPPPDRLSAIDRLLEGLEIGNIAFNAPQSMNLHDTAIIQLMLGLATPVDELKQMIEAEGDKEGTSIRVSDRMEARLSGPNFAITAITPEIQAVSRSEVTEWKWEVKPSTGGHQYLHLTLSVLLSVEGTSTPRAIRTFDKMIEIEVTWSQRVGSFFNKNWQWLWAAVLLPLVGWLWKKRKRTKPDASSSDN
jgi:hypothetical protein